MKKLVVCGDSYLSAISYDENNIDNGAGHHFTELLAKKINWEVITFARGACSNQTIRLQIDEAIKEKPDFVIVSTTSVDRFELPLDDLTTNDYYGKNSLIKYIENNGLYNIFYKGFPDKSSKNVNFNTIEPVLFSETLNNIFNKTSPKKHLDDVEIKILEKWFNRFYDAGWKRQQDGWILADGIRRIVDKNIDFSFICNSLDLELFNFCKDKLVYNESNLNPIKFGEPNVPYRFHTSLKSQEELSENWYKFFKKQNII